MKPTITALLSFFLLQFSFISCRYEEGPLLSLRGVQSRLEGQYSVKYLFINGGDSTEAYVEKCGGYFLFDFHSSINLYNCKSLNGVGEMDGNYNFLNRNNHLEIRFHHPPASGDYIIGFGPFIYSVTTTWDIKRLTNHEIILETTYQSDNYRLQLKKFYY